MIINTIEQTIRAWEDHKDKVRRHMAAQTEKPSKEFSRCTELIDEIYDGNKCRYPALFADHIKACIAKGDFKSGEIANVLDMASKCEKVKAILEGK